MRVKSESIYEHVEFLNEEKDIEGSRAVKKKMKEERGDTQVLGSQAVEIKDFEK